MIRVASLCFDNCFNTPGKETKHSLASSKVWDAILCDWACIALQDCMDSSEELFSLHLPTDICVKMLSWPTLQYRPLAVLLMTWSFFMLKKSHFLLKSGIKWSFSNWIYLALFKLLSILSSFLEPSFFIYLQHIRLLLQNIFFAIWKFSF